MTDTAIIELRPAFRGLCAQLRACLPLMSHAVGHLGFQVSMMESSRDGTLRFVVLFSDVAGNEVRMIWSAIDDDEVALAVRGGSGGRSLGAYRLADLVGARLRDLLDGAIADAIARVAAFAAGRTGAGPASRAASVIHAAARPSRYIRVAWHAPSA